MARIFISHSSRDNAAATSLFKWLREQGFTYTFLDIDKDSGIQPGADWERKLYHELSRCQAVIVVLTKNWHESKWCFVEFAQARALGKAIFPVIESPSGERLVGKDLQQTDLLADRDGGLERLSKAITQIAMQSPDGFELQRGVSPFPGLTAFDEKHAAVFFGRDDVLLRLIEVLRRRLTRGGERLISILGASGSGKSSALRAGLLPRLDRDRENWIVLPSFRPEVDPCSRLIEVLVTALLKEGVTEDLSLLERDLAEEEPVAALRRVAVLLRRHRRALDARIVIAVDQAEELFSVADARSTDRFWKLISIALGEELPFIAVITLRSEYLGRLQSSSSLTVSFEPFPLEPMPLDRVELLVRGPARVVGITVEDRLATTLRHDAQTSDALPLIAFTLARLYEGLNDGAGDRGGDLTWAAYEALGDRAGGLNPLENSVRIAAEKALPVNGSTPEAERALREAFIPSLVRVNPDGQFVRRRASQANLPPAAQPMIDQLVNARLLVRSGAGGDTDIEVTHEALFRVWPRLTGWLEEEREYLIGRDRLEAAMRDWVILSPNDREKGLLSGVLLQRAQGWLAEQPHRLLAAERDFIAASALREQRQIEELRELKRVADQQRYEAVEARDTANRALSDARVARSRFLADLSRQRLAEGRIADAMAFAHLAAPVDDPTWPRVLTAENALSLVVHTYRTAAWRPIVGYVGHVGTVRGGLFNSDDSRLFTWSYDGTARIWDAVTGDSLHTFAHDAAITGAAPLVGDRVLTWSIDHTARLWDLISGEALFVLKHDDAVAGATVSPSGRLLLTWSFDGTARIWDSVTGECRAILRHGAALHGALFMLDELLVLTWGHHKTAQVWRVDNGLLKYQIEHAKTVRRAILLESPSRVLTWSFDQSVRVSDADSGLEIFRIERPASIDGIELTFDRSQLLTWSETSVHLWGLNDGTERIHLQHQDPVAGAVLSDDGSKIMTWTHTHFVQAWRISDGHPGARVLHADVVEGAEFSKDGRRAASFSADGTVKIWTDPAADTEKTNDSATLRHPSAVTAVSLGSDGKFIWTTSADNKIRLWNTDRQLHPVATLCHDDAILAVIKSNDPAGGFVTCSADGTAVRWCGTPDHFCLVSHEADIIDAAFSRDGSMLLTQGNDRTTRLWDAATGQQQAVLRLNSDVVGASFIGDDAAVLTWSSESVQQWDIRRNILTETMFSPGTLRGVICSNQSEWVFVLCEGGIIDARHKDAPNSDYPITHQGRGSPRATVIDDVALVYTTDGCVSVWNLQERQLWWRANGPLTPCDATIAVESCLVAVWSKTTVQVWNLVTGKPTVNLELSGRLLAVSPRSPRLLIASGRHEATLVDLERGVVYPPIRHRDKIGSALLFQDAVRALLVGEYWMSLWNVTDGTLIAEMPRLSLAYNLAVSRDEKRWLVDGTVTDVATGDTLASLSRWGREQQFSLDGGRMVEWSPGPTAQINLMWQSPQTAAQYAAARLPYLRALSASDCRDAYVDVIDITDRSLIARPVSHTSDRLTFSTSSTNSGNLAGPMDMKVELVVNNKSEVFIFHNNPFPQIIKRICYLRSSKRLWFVFQNDTRDFGLAVDPRLARYLTRGYHVQIIQMDEAKGERVAASYCPLAVL